MEHAMVVREDKIAVLPLVLVEVLLVVHLRLQQVVQLRHLVLRCIVVAGVVRHLVVLLACVHVLEAAEWLLQFVVSHHRSASMRMAGDEVEGSGEATKILSGRDPVLEPELLVLVHPSRVLLLHVLQEARVEEECSLPAAVGGRSLRALEQLMRRNCPEHAVEVHLHVRCGEDRSLRVVVDLHVQYGAESPAQDLAELLCLGDHGVLVKALESAHHNESKLPGECLETVHGQQADDEVWVGRLEEDAVRLDEGVLDAVLLHPSGVLLVHRARLVDHPHLKVAVPPFPAGHVKVGAVFPLAGPVLRLFLGDFCDLVEAVLGAHVQLTQRVALEVQLKYAVRGNAVLRV
mmetsp:Transcript_15785/g.61678  ORF Transcript_15785/g.61678 Transcript_15785/m.61678 type:complete len:347 (-) Transcript_15785:948-1988(-)